MKHVSGFKMWDNRQIEVIKLSIISGLTFSAVWELFILQSRFEKLRWFINHSEEMLCLAYTGLLRTFAGKGRTTRGGLKVVGCKKFIPATCSRILSRCTNWSRFLSRCNSWSRYLLYPFQLSQLIPFPVAVSCPGVTVDPVTCGCILSRCANWSRFL